MADEESTKVAEFASVTGTDPDRARFYLEAAAWDLNVSIFFIVGFLFPFVVLCKLFLIIPFTKGLKNLEFTSHPKWILKRVLLWVICLIVLP